MQKVASKTIFVTGGTWFVGSHICVELLTEGFEVVVADNLTNSSEGVLERITRITGNSVIFYKTDIRDRESLESIFEKHTIDVVVHCAGLKSVVESVKNPLSYYDNNVYGSIVLMQVMAKYNVKKLIFSSSACIYRTGAPVPYTETSLIKPVNPYGKSKLFIEEILRDIASSDSEWRIALLRYFNPIGAHASGFIGEDPNGIPNNLMPYICQVALGRQPELLVFGDDYETPDGTGIRDYIHVVDLALGHVKAISWLDNNTNVLTANLGTGKGVSVLELVKAFTKASERSVPYRVMPRRAGDVAISYSDASLAEKELGWRAVCTIGDACRDAWRWQQLNPRGYK